MERNCAVCDKKAPQSCSACFKVDYCSVEHQKQHWKVHKRDCSYFKITEDPKFPELGKGLVATRDIKAGAIILEESPALFSTMAAQPACIACGFIFSPGKLALKCGTCQWPVCSRRCEKAVVHADNECKLLASKGFKLNPQLGELRKDENAILTFFLRLIRALLLKKSGSDIYEKILELESEHGNPGFHSDMEGYLKFLKPILTFLDFSVEDEELRRLFQIFVINCHKGTPPYEDSNCSISALYLKASRMNHSCAPNCDWSISQPPDFKVRIRAVVNIRKGEPLTIAHYGTPMIWATKMRQIFLLGGGFQCKCKRCLDPTELGTYSSAVVCTSCRSKSKQTGYFLPQNPLNLSDDSSWKCNICGSTKLASILLRPIEGARELIHSKLGNYIESGDAEALMKMCKGVEEKYSGKSLHPNHYLIQDCLRAVVIFFAMPKHGLVRLDWGTQEYVITCGYHFLAIHDAVSPGWSYIRATLQRQIARALEFQGYLTTQSVSEEEFQNLKKATSIKVLNTGKLNEAMELYKESLKYFEGDFGGTSDVNKLRSSIECIENALMNVGMERMSTVCQK